MRYYSSVAVDTALTSQIGSSATSISVDSVTGYPTQFPFTIVIDPDTANEELCEVTNVAGTSMTVTRAFDGTTAVAHAVGAAVKHVLSAEDLREPQQHIAATSSVHGVTGSVVGTSDVQTLTNKTFISPEEVTTVSASAATGTINFDAVTHSVLYYTSNASANWAFNFRGNSGATLSSILPVGSALTLVFLNTNGATPYYPTAFQVDGTAIGVTLKWQGGVAPIAGNASSVDAYTFTIVKTAATPAYTILASQVKFA